MTPDGISNRDWGRVRACAAAIANAVITADGSIEKAKRNRLLEILDELDSKYGQRPSLLATRAEYSGEPRSRAVKLLQRAFELAIETGDLLNQRLTASSLVELYLDQPRSVSKARHWYGILRRFPASDRVEKSDLRRFALAIGRAGVKASPH